jgi:cytochrome b561
MSTAASAGPGTGIRRNAVLLVLTCATLALIAAQFALAGLGAFTTLKAPSGNAYAAHLTIGIAIGALTWLILAVVLASPAARGSAGIRWPAVALALLAVPVEPLLGEAGRHVPAVGALHAVTGLAIFALTARLTGAVARRREAASVGQPAAGANPAEAGRR